MQTPGFAGDSEPCHLANAPGVASAASAMIGTPSRYCLLGADHRLNPRTYCSASLVAIQRTEVLEWAMLRSSSPLQSTSTSNGAPEHTSLLPIQPYKLLYAHTLAEFGRVTDALAYCQVCVCVCVCVFVCYWHSLIDGWTSTPLMPDTPPCEGMHSTNNHPYPPRWISDPRCRSALSEQQPHPSKLRSPS